MFVLYYISFTKKKKKINEVLPEEINEIYLECTLIQIHKIIILHDKLWARSSHAANNTSIIRSLVLDLFTSAEHIFVWILIIQD